MNEIWVIIFLKIFSPLCILFALFLPVRAFWLTMGVIAFGLVIVVATYTHTEPRHMGELVSQESGDAQLWVAGIAWALTSIIGLKFKTHQAP